MFADSGVEAFVSNLEALNRSVAKNVLLDDLFGIGQSHVAIPNGFGINDHCRTVLALVEASRLVGAYGSADTSDGEKALELLVESSGAGRIATATRVSYRSLVAADEDVFVELGHL
jgi:hypothetical protein